MCGVRQEGVLSPILFAHYINDIIIKLPQSKLSCHIGNVFVGCIMFVDDLVLLSASIAMLQRMIDVCSEEVKYLDISFNVSKSTIIRIGKKFKHVCSNLLIDNDVLEFSESMKYLGVYLVSGIR